MKKTLHTILAATAIAAAVTSCLEDKESYTAGFLFAKPSSGVTAVYANTPSDTIVFYSYGNWNSSATSGSWCTLGKTSGQGGVYHTIPVSYQPNTTGDGRGIQVTLRDASHGDNAQATLLLWQYATRGDGTLGAAADVKTIAGSDGSLFEFGYDALHRPLSLRVTKDGTLLHNLKLAYSDQDSTLTLSDQSKTLTGKYQNNYQPEELIGSGDTVRYASQYYAAGLPVAANYAFNLEHHTASGNDTHYAFLLGGQSLRPDSLHCTDSLRIARVRNGVATISSLKLDYSAADNRHQSVDVNQLVFGAEQCDPYQLISLFRHARSTSIVSTVTADEGHQIRVAAELRADQSVSRLTVSRTDLPQDADGAVITYDFTY